MDRTTLGRELRRTVRVLPLGLTLLLGGLVLAEATAPATAHAQSTDKPATTTDPNVQKQRTERKVLKASEADLAAMQSAEYREKAHQARLESIERLKEIIKTTQPTGDTKAEMLLRLSDLYFEEGRDLYLAEMQANVEAQDKCFNTPGCDMTSVKPDNTGSRQWQDKSIKLYQQILANYPQFARADEATFYLGQALADIGQTDEANNQFTRLVKTYPESTWIPDAYVLIGEYWFDKNQAFKALSAYQRAAAYKDHDKYAFANYKLAWCYYNVGDYPKAIDTMKAVVAFSNSNADAAKNKSNIQLQDEALKDLVRFFADAGEMDEAYEYFNKLGKKELIRDMLKRLASTYFEQGKFDQAVQTYRRIISEDPNGASAPDFQNEIIQCYTKMGKKEDTLAEIDRLLKTYGKSSAWARANAANQDAVKSANEFIEKNLRTVATNYHNEAKKLRTGDQAKQTYALAEKAYEVYLNEFPDSKYSYDVRYGYSELLYTIKKFDVAYDQYMKVVAIDPKGQHSEFCAESAIFAADEMLKRESHASGGPGPDPGKKTDPIPLTEWEQKSLDALDQYQKLFKDNPKTPKIIYKSAYLLYNKNHFKEASDRFRVVIGINPAAKEAEQAANLILDSFNLVEDWVNLKDVSKAFYDQQGLGSPDFKKEVYGIYENASLKLIDVNFKKGNDKAKAAADYMAFYKEFPTSANADFALNNASVYYHDLAQTTDEIATRLELINKFGAKSKYYKGQVSNLGFNYESIADFSQAADWYEKLFTLDNKDTGAPDAIFSAALFRVSLGQWEQGIKDYQQYMATYPDKPNLNGITLDIAGIYEEHEKWPEAAKVYQTFFAAKTPPPNATIEQIMYARLHYGLLMDKLGQSAKVTQHWKDTLAWFQKAKGGEKGAPAADVGASMDYVGQIMFILAEPQNQAFLAMKIDGPGDKKLPQKQVDKLLKDQLVAKTKAMKALEETYGNIVSTGAGEWGLASLVKLGQAYENMAETLKSSYVPSYLTDDQKELYGMAIIDKAYPQTQKAAAAYSEALKKAYELNLYNDNTANATRRLGVLVPDEYPGLFEKVPEARFGAPSVFTASFESEP
jgi:tetratricopeptide (TPR) repeat protein